MGILEFMSENPFLTFFIVLAICATIVSVANTIKGGE